MEAKKKKIRIRGLRKRWLINAIGPILVVALLGVAVFSVSIANYYYGGMRSGLEAKAREATGAFNTYAMNSYNEFYQTAYSYTETFEDKDKLELQFIGSNGRILVSTLSGVTSGLSPGTVDISEALTQNEIGYYMGEDPATGQSIMAVSAPLEFDGRVVGCMRYVTAMDRVNRQLLISILVAVLVALVALAMVYFSNMVFINNVVAPVAEVTETAKRISGGSYGIQLENHYQDEIGELIDSINDMSTKIGQSEKVKSEFISSVSHELRTPLTAINGWGETLLEGDEDPEELRRGVGIILKESKRLTSMVEELLDFSRMEDGRFTLRVEQADIQAEFEDTIFTYQALLRQEGITLNYDGGDQVIDPTPGDPERLKQVFCNVLDNAAKHGGSGKRIDTAIRKEQSVVVLTVRDYGPGIPEEELPFVKQKFYKGSSKARGSGIGLAVCDEIIRLHNGEFSIDNAAGGGAIVTIVLPAEE